MKAVDAHTFNKQAKSLKIVCQKADGNYFWDRKGVVMVNGIHATREHNVRSVLRNAKNTA
jgi:hypothetical protein